jgi:hypothetical protein
MLSAFASLLYVKVTPARLTVRNVKSAEVAEIP